MTAVGWAVYGISVVSVVCGLAFLLGTIQIRMSRELHGEAVATYHKARDKSDESADANSDPIRRGDPVHSLVIRPLPTADRTRFVDDWRSLQPLFVNDPEDALKEADRLISDVMQTQGYPMGEFAQRADDLSVEHPDIVHHYLEAHRLAQRAANGRATTDEERRALIEYRQLFDELLSDGLANGSSAQHVSQTGKLD